MQPLAAPQLSQQATDVLLAIESSCDETAAAVIDRNLNVLSNVVASQTSLHQRFGGVVPEIASRAHLTQILPVVDEALREAGVALEDLVAIAVVNEPGLVGSLLVGLTAAKTLAMTLRIPLVPVDHIQAHIYACRLAEGREIFPAIGLVVSGGHTNLYDCRGPLDFEVIGTTIDDAAGEAFDKAAQVLGLGFPGGPAIEKAAANGDRTAFDFPRTFLKDEQRLEFSFSGLKTAVLYTANGTPGSHAEVPKMTPERTADIAASFQQSVVDVLTGKCEQSLRRFDRKTLCVGGGVAANRRLRQALAEMADRLGIRLLIAPLAYCTDNAAMAGIAWESLNAGLTASLDLDVVPGLVRRR